MPKPTADVLKRHPLPWRVTKEYAEWWERGGHDENPPAVVDALYRDDLPKDAPYAEERENDKHVVITSSEWLGLDPDVAQLIVDRVNAAGE